MLPLLSWSSLLLLVPSILASPVSNHQQPLPLIVWHGLGDNYLASGLHRVGDLANKTNPGTYTYYIRLDDDASSDRTATFLGNLTTQLAQVCTDITTHPILSQAQGLNALGFSQGGQFLRGLVQTCPKARIRNLVTFGSQHNGIAKYQVCGATDWVCKGYIGLLKANTWSEWVQSHLVPAQYFRVTDDATGEPTPDYLAHSNFLADMNNERARKNPHYARNLASLAHFVMYVFEKDTTVVPKESGWFAQTNLSSGEVTGLRDRRIYKEDWIGLKTLDEKGGLTFETVWDAAHMEIEDEVLVDVFEKYFSVRDLSRQAMQEVVEL